MPAENLLTPLKFGRHTMKNRFVMAPLTRCRADADHVPTAMMAKYYVDRASMGLIIAEATQIQKGYSTFAKEPGLYDPGQIRGWKAVTDAVHAKGGLIYCQIHHGGRATVPCNLDAGMKVVGASENGITGHASYFNKDGSAKLPYPEKVHPLTKTEIGDLVALFVQAAKNAIEAGFDGVEVHGANGYLIDQFIKSSSNKRTDEYGGTMEKRCRFLFEVLDAVCKAIGSDRVGLRLSPLNSFNNGTDEKPEELTKYLCKELNSRNLAFLDVMRGDFFTPVRGADVWARSVYTGTLFSGMGFEIDEADSAVANKEADAIIFGTKALANPDLVERATKGAALNAPRQDKFYTPGEEGYNDYPTL